MAKTKKVPQLRFKGFEEQWEENILGDVTKSYSGGTPMVWHSEYYGGQIPFIRSAEINSNSTEISITQKGFENSSAKMVIAGDILYALYGATSGEVGRARIAGAINQAILAIRPEDSYDAEFLMQWLRKQKEIIISTYLQGGQGNLSGAIVKDLRIFASCYDEQRKIGELIKNLDALIALHQRKHDKLTTVKKAMLEKMFPKEGTDVPEIRFKGFSDKWDRPELDNLADRYDNLRVPITATNRMPGDTPYYGANGIQDFVEGYTHNGEFILVAEDGANDTKNYPVQYVTGKIWVNNHAHVLQEKKNKASLRFLKYAISRTNIEPLLVGGGRAKLNAEAMMSIIIVSPNELEEQKKIGSYFMYLDSLISLQQRELDKLKEIKKACLEKMFV
jgi:type I restriction enzyme S subunit